MFISVFHYRKRFKEKYKILKKNSETVTKLANVADKAMDVSKIIIVYKFSMVYIVWLCSLGLFIK